MKLEAKVFGIVSSQLLATISIVSLFMWSETLQLFAVRYYTCFILSGFFVSIISLFACMFTKNNYPTNMYWLTLFTVSNAIELGSFCGVLTHVGHKILIIQALGLTTLLTVILTRLAMIAETDYGYIRPVLNTIIVGLLTAGVITLTIYEIPYHGIIVGVTGSVTFCLYLFIDVQEITRKLSEDDYIEAAIQVYLDIINIFVHVLCILIELAEKEKSKKSKK